MPFTVLVHDPAKLPLRQLELDQRKGCIGPSAGFDQPIDPSFAAPRMRRNIRTPRHHVGHQFRRHRLGATKPRLQHTKVLLVFRIEQHDTSRKGCGLKARPFPEMGKMP